MAKLKIIGRAKLEYVSQKVAENLIRMKEQYEPNHMVEIGSGEYLELGQIKQIIPDDQNVISEIEINEQKSRERQADMVEWNDYVNCCRQQSIEQKARRMVKSWCALLWTARMNRPVMQIPEEIKDLLMIRLIEYFEKNPTEWHAEKALYGDLIPFGKVVVVSNVKGIKSIGQMFQGSLI